MFCVFHSDQADDYLLVATVPGVGCYDIAMRLTPDEVAMFQASPPDFVTLARDFVASRDLPIFKTRRIPICRNGVDLLEIET